MVDFDGLRALVNLAEHGSFQRAAIAGGTSRARLRRKIASLEEQTGTRLLLRVNGLLRPTKAGESLVAGARRMLDEAASLVAHAREIGTEPIGVLRVGLQVGFPYELALLGWRYLRDRYRALRIDARIAEDPLELVPSEVDFAIRASPDRAATRHTEIELAVMRQQVFASPRYLASHGAPRSPQQVLDHELCCWRGAGASADELHLSDGDRLSVSPSVALSDERLLYRYAAEGDTMIYAPAPPLPDPHFAQLVPVLAKAIGRPIRVCLYVPTALQDVPRVKAVVDAMRSFVPPRV